MVGGITAFLLVFYAGAVAMTAMAWLAVFRGAVDFTTLRELTGIADRTVLTRLFGPADPTGRFAVTSEAVLRHRRKTGALLSDLPVHLLFLVALLWAAGHAGAPAATAILIAAMAHGIAVGVAAVLVIVGNHQILLD